MEIVRFDIDNNSGVFCPISEIEIDFADENITDCINDTFVLGVFISIQPEECAIAGAINDQWINHYEKHHEQMDLEDLIASFPGPYKAIEVKRRGVACGPMAEVAYYVVAQDSVINFMVREK